MLSEQPAGRTTNSNMITREAPDQPGGQKAVIEPLIHGEDGRGRGDLRGHREDPPADGMVPEEHLQHQEAEVSERDQRGEDVGDDVHGREYSGDAAHCSPLQIQPITEGRPGYAGAPRTFRGAWGARG